ncbi:MAG: YdcF family protein [Betaproteobacteria bacterium]
MIATSFSQTSMGFLLTKIIAVCLQPLLAFLLAGTLGLLLLRWHRRAGLVLLVVSFGGLFVLSLPVVAVSLAKLVEAHPTSAVIAPDAQAIVILAGGNYVDAPEYAGDTVNSATLERVRWGARLHRSTGLPIAVTGGAPYSRTPEASQMQATLSKDFGVQARWVEDKSLTTFENARNLRVMLAREQINRIVLVTHALHMPRAHLAFVGAGFQVSDSATIFTTMPPLGILGFLPGVRSLALSSDCLYEIIGTGWYHLRLAANR